MKYEIISKENDFIAVSFSGQATIDAQIYSAMSHNSAILMPGTRDLSVENTINYDTLGSVSMLEEIQKETFDKASLYSFLIKILDTLDKILALGINERQLVFDCSHMYISLYDKSVRFLCVPVVDDIVEPVTSPADMFRTIALTVKSDGAYELLGYVIEKTTREGFSISEFRNGLVEIFNSENRFESTRTMPSSISIPSPEGFGQSPEAVSVHESEFVPSAFPATAYVGREYAPAGVPLVCNEASDSAADTVEPDNKTQVLLAGVQDIADIPYISPVEDNTPEARIYIVGEKLTIGRSSENDLQINATTISSRHAEIHRTGKKCTINDLNSTNKTYVNGIAIKPNTSVRLKHRDLIAFNKIRYRFFEH